MLGRALELSRVECEGISERACQEEPGHRPLARRFLDENPPEALLQRLTAGFCAQDRDGGILTMASLHSAGVAAPCFNAQDTQKALKSGLKSGSDPEFDYPMITSKLTGC